jgi:uncharacterized membrane protein
MIRMSEQNKEVAIIYAIVALIAAVSAVLSSFGYSGVGYYIAWCAVLIGVVGSTLLASAQTRLIFIVPAVCFMFASSHIGTIFISSKHNDPTVVNVLDTEAVSGFLGLSHTYRIETDKGVFTVHEDAFSKGEQLVLISYTSRDGLASRAELCRKENVQCQKV